MALVNGANMYRLLSAIRANPKLASAVVRASAGAVTAAGGAIGGAIANARKRKASNPVAEPVPIKKRMAASSSKPQLARSGGKMKKGRRVNKKKKAYKMAMNGPLHHLETNGTVSASPDVQAMLHSSCPIKNLQKRAWEAVVTAVMRKAGFQITSLDQVLVDGVAGAYLKVDYYVSPGSAVATTATLALGTTETIDGVANAIILLFTADSVTIKDYMFDRITYYPPALTATQYCGASLNLRGAKVKFLTKNSLKIQNRTVEATGDETVDVNNVPLRWTKYCYKGNSLMTRVRQFASAQTSLTTQNYRGFLAQSYSQAGLSGMAEPPSPATFVGVKTVAKGILEPGSIQTSVINSTFSTRLDFLFRYQGGIGTSTSEQVHRYGNSCMILFDKMINTTNAQNIQLGFECQQDTSANLKLVSQKFVLESFEKNTY